MTLVSPIHFTAKDAIPVAAADLIKQHKLQVTSSIKMRKAALENCRAGSSNKENSLCLSNGVSGKSRNSDDNLKSRQLMLFEKMKKEMKCAKEGVKSPSGEGKGPQLEVDFNREGLIDMDMDTQQDSFKSKTSARMTQEELAKARAVALIKRKGKLEKKDPNETQKTKKPLDERALKEIRKRTEANRKSSSDGRSHLFEMLYLSNCLPAEVSCWAEDWWVGMLAGGQGRGR